MHKNDSIVLLWAEAWMPEPLEPKEFQTPYFSIGKTAYSTYD